ncbi:MAG: ABC transporter ATP-binding protein [Gammaproteobacteria bacterium]|nr:ABC transporter ATP-binding protein [Gammaproteobacteria bacterium]
MSAVIEAKGLTKYYGKTRAVDGASFSIHEGRIVGLIGPNGAGKTTALKAILGLTNFKGELKVLGLDPYRERDRLMQQVCFIADVAVLPRWLKVSNAVDFMEAIHPKFERSRAMDFLSRTDVSMGKKVGELSKGMVTQLHLALIMAIDAKLLILDEPTLGLDILSRKDFYRALLSDYFDEKRTILITTHQVEEIEHILTDLLFINKGRIVLDATMEAVAENFVEVAIHPDHRERAESLRPLYEHQVFGRSVFLYDGIARDKLVELGDVRTPSVADLFVAKVRGEAA